MDARVLAELPVHQAHNNHPANDIEQGQLTITDTWLCQLRAFAFFAFKLQYLSMCIDNEALLETR